MAVDEIPVAKTPNGGWTTWPDPVLAGCHEPLPDGAPDLRGLWQTVEVLVGGELVPGHPALGHVQRVEQAGDRLVVTAAGVVHDMRCDGTLENGVHDVAEFDKVTAIRVVASYEDGMHVLRPDGLDLGSDVGSIEVKRWRDGAHMMWQYVGFTARLHRLGPPEVDPTTTVPIGQPGDN